jgi:hypothetical protein
MASHILADISRLDLADLSAPDGKITSLQHVASYNWLEKPVPTISVPGKAALARDVSDLLALIKSLKVLPLFGRRHQFPRS